MRQKNDKYEIIQVGLAIVFAIVICSTEHLWGPAFQVPDVKVVPGFERFVEMQSVQELSKTPASKMTGQLALFLITEDENEKKRWVNQVHPMDDNFFERTLQAYFPDFTVQLYPFLAQTPDEVATVVFIEEDKHITGKYTDGDNAVRTDLIVRIVNPSVPELILPMKVFRGGDPPSERYGDESGRGTIPHDEALQYILSLR